MRAEDLARVDMSSDASELGAEGYGSVKFRFLGDLDTHPVVASVESQAFARTLRQQRYMLRTRQLYVTTIAHFDAWLRERGTTLRSFAVEHVLDYSETLPFTYASRQRFINALKAYWRFHLRRKPDECPAQAVFCPKRPEQVYRGLEDGAEARRVIEAAAGIDVRAAAGAALCYFAALRCTEAATLPRSADEGDWLTVMGKGAQPRILPVVAELRERLDAAYDAHRESEWVLPSTRSRSSGPISPNTLQTWVKLAGERAGFRSVTPHVLRYTAGGVILDETDDLHGVGRYLGHSKNSLGITAGYTRRKQQRLRDLGGKL